MQTKFFKKIAIRLAIFTFVFICIKLTFELEEDFFIFKKVLFYYSTSIISFLITWELSDYLIKRNIKKFPLNSLDLKLGIQMTGLILIINLPVFIVVYYLANFNFSAILELQEYNSWTQFRVDLFRAVLITITISVCNLYYFSGKIKKNLENKMLLLERELSVSKYLSLKNQISPHFLFNSLNTLTSLMYQDRDLASDFTLRLASCYRYILENQEQDLVELDKELAFLNSYIFMMEVRHKSAVQITIDTTIKTGLYVIPTLTLQMLLENALKHNSFSMDKPLKVTITISAQGITVTNNLRPCISKESSTKLGLKNIKKRFSFYTNTLIIVEMDDENYTVVLPLLKYTIEQNILLQPAL